MTSKLDFIYKLNFLLPDENRYRIWLESCALCYGASSLNLVYAFMEDTELLKLNAKYLSHNELTDIITFDDTVGKDVSANIAISIDRVRENAVLFGSVFEDEVLRVMSHGLLHCLGHTDKNESDKRLMRQAENNCIQMFHVKQNHN